MKKISDSQASLGNHEKVNPLDFWNIVFMLSILVNGFKNCIILINELSGSSSSNLEDLVTMSLAFGGLLAWINVLFVTRKYSNLAIVYKTFFNSASGVYWFILGILPLFLAFVYGAFGMFHEIQRFENAFMSYLDFMILLTGHNIQGNCIETLDFTFGPILMTIWSIVFMITITNIIINIIVAGYETGMKEITEIKNSR